MKPIILALVLALSACGGHSSSPTTPTRTPIRHTITGHLSATNGGQPLAGVISKVGDVDSNVTDTSGTFSLRLAAGRSQRLTLTGDAIVPRMVWLAVNGPRDLALDAFGADGFDLTFYRAYVRDGWESPNALRPLRRLTQAPKIYLRSIDEAGNAIDPVTLETAAAALIDTAAIWSGNRFALAGMERGTERRDGQSGWITVVWPNPVITGICGQSLVGVDGGRIDLNYLHILCGCNGSKIRPLVVRHELGHSFGYFHTGAAGDLMSGLPVSQCDLQPSARERLYANYAYSRPVGNTDPDHDPIGTVNPAPYTVR